MLKQHVFLVWPNQKLDKIKVNCVAKKVTFFAEFPGNSEVKLKLGFPGVPWVPSLCEDHLGDAEDIRPVYPQPPHDLDRCATLWCLEKNTKKTYIPVMNPMVESKKKKQSTKRSSKDIELSELQKKMTGESTLIFG